MITENSNSCYWCDHCQVPVLGNICLACGKNTRNISSFIKPVYPQEIDFIKHLFKGMLSNKVNGLNYWVNTNNNTYFLNGKPFFKLNNSNEGIDNLKIQFLTKNKPRVKRRSTEEIRVRIKKANEAYIKSMQYEAESFIREVADKYRKRTFVVSFSGGKDSITVSHLVMSAFGRSDVLHLFADTSLELTDTYDFINSFQRNHPLTPFYTCKSSLNFFETAKQIGSPSRIQRWCCTTHKTNPLADFISLVNPKNGVLAFDGVRKSESTRRSKYFRISTKHKIKNEILASPIIEWTDIQVWLYLLYHNLQINESYLKGFRRVGCFYCPFNSVWSEIMIQNFYPAQYQNWQKFLYEQAKAIKHPNPDVFVQKGWRVRAGGRGLDNYKTIIESNPCLITDDAEIYQILSGNMEEIKEFLKPFGDFIFVSNNCYTETFIVKDRISKEALFTAEINTIDNTVRIHYVLQKNKFQFRMRIEKQIKKTQSCIKCGACAAECHVNAIYVDNVRGIYQIDSELCTHCKKCVSVHCPAVDSLKERKGKKAKWQNLNSASINPGLD